MIRGSITVVTLALNNQAVLSPNEKRRSVAFHFGQATGHICVNNRKVASVTDGFAVGSWTVPFTFKYEDVGDLVCGGWYAFADNAGDTLVITEGTEV